MVSLEGFHAVGLDVVSQACLEPRLAEAFIEPPGPTEQAYNSRLRETLLLVSFLELFVRNIKMRLRVVLLVFVVKKIHE